MSADYVVLFVYALFIILLTASAGEILEVGVKRKNAKYIVIGTSVLGIAVAHTYSGVLTFYFPYTLINYIYASALLCQGITAVIALCLIWALERVKEKREVM